MYKGYLMKQLEQTNPIYLDYKKRLSAPFNQLGLPEND